MVLHNCGLYQSGFNGLESNHSQQEFVYEFLSEWETGWGLDTSPRSESRAVEGVAAAAHDPPEQ